MNLVFLKSSRWARRALWAAMGLLGLWALLWASVPTALRYGLETWGSEALGRRLTVGGVDFRPWSLELTLRDVAVAGPQGQGVQLSLPRLYVDAELQSVLRLAPVVDALTIEAPALSLRRQADGHYDIDDLLQKFNTPAKPDDKPAAFALYNLTLTGGQVTLHDERVDRTHEIRDLELSLPFISSLASKREVRVTPRLSLLFNGSRLETQASTTPFADNRHADVALKLDGLDLAPYLPYLPAGLPVRPQAARLDLDMTLAFEQTPNAHVRLAGQAQLSDVRVADATGAPLLAFRRLQVDLTQWLPLERKIHVAAIHWDGPDVQLRRDAQGGLTVLAAHSPNKPSATTSATTPVTTPAPGAVQPQTPRHGERGVHKASSVPSAVGEHATEAAVPAAWQAQVDRVAVQGGQVQWLDESVTPPARLSLVELDLKASDLRWPMTRAAHFESSLQLAGPVRGPDQDKAVGKVAGKSSGKGPDKGPDRSAGVSGERSGGRLFLSGQGTVQGGGVSLRAQDVPLGLARPYLAAYWKPELSGRLTAVGGVGWRGQEVAAKLVSLSLEEVALREQGEDLAGWRQLQVRDARLDLAARTLKVAEVAWQDPRGDVSRGVDGRWMYESWTVEAPKPLAGSGAPRGDLAEAQQKTPSPQSPTGSAGGGWAMALDRLGVAGGQVRFRDVVGGRTVALEVQGLQLSAGPLVVGGGAAPAPVALQVAARVGSGAGVPGRLDYKGTVAWAPLGMNGRLEAVRLPVHAVEPYVADKLNIELLRAEGSFRGQVAYTSAAAGPQLKLSGDAALEDVRVNSVLAQSGAESGPPISDELLSWKALGFQGVALSMMPGQPLNLEVRETSINDFYARVVINESGRINLQDLVRASAPPPGPAGASGAGGASAGPTTVTAAAAGAAFAGAKGEAAAEAAPVIRFGPMGLVNGRVLFSDRFIKPNYSANLSELAGRLSAFSSLQSPEGDVALADLELRGRAEGAAALEIAGKINPLARPLAFKIEGRMRGLELPPLSPYSVKYAGHGIERGKLSVNVAYEVLPNGQLTASNNIILNQLTFGDAVEGAPASLPVKLAVALLADRNGTIDINLPISGSLNDPEFRLGPVIGRVIVNLIGKAITAPFALLASALGGGADELSEIAFAPGSAALGPEARAALDKVAQVLAQRPALKVSVQGVASVEAEREAYRRQRLMQMVVAEKRRAAAASGAALTEPVTVGESEYPALLKAVYRRVDIPRPRNLVGLLKDLPQADMEALLLASLPVSDESILSLASQRAAAVRDHLGGLNVPSERLFVDAPRLEPSSPKWQPHAELSLQLR